MATRMHGPSRVAPGLFEDADENYDLFEFGGFDSVPRLWPRTEPTRPPVGDEFLRAAAIVVSRVPTNLPRFPGSFAKVCYLYSAVPIDTAGTMLPTGTIVYVDPSVEQEHVAGTATLHETSAAEPDSDEVGAASSGVLVEAFDALRGWLQMRQIELAAYVGISPSTVMAWKREATRYPRHARIPALLTLWSAVAAARAELGAEGTSQLIWSSGREGYAPAVAADELADLLMEAATEASNAAWLDDDGYIPGESTMPSVDELYEAESHLARDLAAGHRGDADYGQHADVPRP